jgi:16S rRNA (cytosine967-C5)-methyltransferase
MSSNRKDNIVEHAAAILRMFEIEPRPLDRIVDHYFKKRRELGSRLRRAIADAVFGVARWRRRIDGLLLGDGVKKPGWRDRVQAFEEPGERLADLPAKGFPGGDAAYHSFPDFLYGMMREQYGAEGAAQLASALNREQRPTLRINSLRTDRDDAMRRLEGAGIECEETERSPYGIRLSERIDLKTNDLFSEGLIEIQDEGSQLACLLASPERESTVLDACAGAGGKGLMIAMLMGGAGRVVAHDSDEKKLRETGRRAARAGVKIETTSGDPSVSLRDAFDLVFVDAPCSGTGTLRRCPDIRWRIDEETIEGRAAEQRKILRAYSRCVRPGGRLVYATCSILRQENERVVEPLLSSGGFTRLDAREVLSASGVNCDGIVSKEGFLFTDPRAGEWDGLFAAVMRRV